MKREVAQEYEMLVPVDQLLIDTLISTLVAKDQKIARGLAEVEKQLDLRGEGIRSGQPAIKKVAASNQGANVRQ